MKYPEKHIENGLSYSAIKLVMQAPALYHWQYVLENFPPDSDSKRLGRAIDCLALEPDKWGERFVLQPEDMPIKRGKANLARWDELYAEAGERTILKADQYETAMACAESARAYEIYSNGPPFSLTSIMEKPDTRVQTDLRWTETVGPNQIHVRFQGQPDVVAAGGRIVLDLKTTGRRGEAHPDSFNRKAGEYYYDVQAAMYLAGARAQGWAAQLYLLVVVETQPPYLCAVHQIGDETIGWAEHAYRHAAWLWRTCANTGKWPGYPGRINTIDVPPWIRRRREETRGGE